MQAFTEGLIEGHIATDIIITISGWAGPSHQREGRGAYAIRALPDLCLGIACCASSGVAGLPGGVLVFGFHAFSSERKFSIHKAPLETYMSKLCV